ncbi:MAG: dihydropteroate synthase [Candidatus Sumerlaeota bacterium]|nr:dihydropteroate synthase [Candidatus Sumerlaeota bacterium]
MNADIKEIWDCGRVVFDLGARPLVMGVLNVTPDSFSDGGQFSDPARAASRSLEMIEEGADLIDIGGESTRPGAAPVAAAEELRRVAPVIEAIRARSQIAISVDTEKASVARRALELGADVINDVTGFRGDPEMAPLAAASRCGLVVMHMQGTPRDMQKAPHYENVVEDLRRFYKERLRTLGRAGINATRIVLDPGIGFGKTLEHNLELIAQLPRLAEETRPQLIGVSRKSFIAAALHQHLEPQERLEGTAAAVAISVWNGAVCVRVHDVRPMRRVADMAWALRAARSPGLAQSV